MSVETWFRICFTVVAIGTAIYLAAGLVTGRTRVGRRTVERAAEPRIYWGAIGKTATLLAGLIIGTIQPSDDNRLPIIFLGLVAGQLFEILFTGIVQMPPTAFSRAAEPKKYWRWAAFHAVFMLLLAGFLIAQATHVIIL